MEVSLSEYGNLKITRRAPVSRRPDFIRADTRSRSGCETVDTFAPPAGARNALSTLPVYMSTVCHCGTIEPASSRPPSAPNIANDIRPRFSLWGFAASHCESSGLSGSGRESANFIFRAGE